MDETTVDLNGVRIYTRRVGDGPPVVVLHGGPGAHHDYLLPQYDRLALGRTLLYYDQRGGGRSPVPRDTAVGWREQVADLEALRDYWGLERVALLGYSWGGLLALLYALEHPARIDRLALVSSAPLTAAWRDEFERRLAARLAEPWLTRARAELTATGLSRTDPEKYRRLAFALSVAGYFHDPRLAREMTPFRVTARTQQEVWRSLGEYDLRARLRQTFPDGAAPRSLVLHGIYEPMPLESARETAALLSTGVIEHATGHAPHVEATEDFVRAHDPFLSQALSHASALRRHSVRSGHHHARPDDRQAAPSLGTRAARRPPHARPQDRRAPGAGLSRRHVRAASSDRAR